VNEGTTPLLLHATCVAIDGRGVLLEGPSGSGKSDLALRLIDRGARLVSDDYTLLSRHGGRLIASAPDTIHGLMEVRGLGIVAEAPAEDMAVALLVRLYGEVPRMPPDPCESWRITDIDLPTVVLSPFEASAAIKVERALDLFGLKEPAA
jgi:hypothetical protein